jgi:hypothetical protein
MHRYSWNKVSHVPSLAERQSVMEVQVALRRQQAQVQLEQSVIMYPHSRGVMGAQVALRRQQVQVQLEQITCTHGEHSYT